MGDKENPHAVAFFPPSVLCFHLCHSSNYWQYWKQLFWRCIKSLFFVIQQVSGIGSSYCSPFDFSLFPCWMHVDLAWFPALPAALPNRAVAFENTALLKNKLEQSRLGFQREWKDLDPCCCALQCDWLQAHSYYGALKGIWCNNRLEKWDMGDHEEAQSQYLSTGKLVLCLCCF